jgi:sugar (pentulose or hexulose) kinase
MLGDRTSFSDRRASFTGLTLSTTREDLALAIIESATGRLQADLRRLGRVVELSKVIRLTGRRAGAALSAYKERRLRGFRFESRESCALLGCAMLSRKLRGRGAAGT